MDQDRLKQLTAKEGRDKDMPDMPVWFWILFGLSMVLALVLLSVLIWAIITGVLWLVQQ